MDITFTTPALLFPAISLVMLAYTNRFLALGNRVRSLHEKYHDHQQKHIILGQIKNIRYRLKLIKNMQAFGILSFLFCIICMYCIYSDFQKWANTFFTFSLISFTISLLLSLVEIQKSTKAIELDLSDMEGLEDPSVLGYIKSKFEKENNEKDQ